MKWFFAVLLPLCLVPSGAQASSETIAWPDLVDQRAQDFEDPFKGLSVSTLADMSTIVRLRKRLESGEVTAEARPRLVGRLKLKEGGLAEAGIDLDGLLSQRWIVANKRKAAAWAANADLDGQGVTIMGFFLAGRAVSGGLATYLVPEFGMCSHMPPPPPNQLLRLELPEGTELPDGLYAPVEITGELDLVRNDQSVHVVDGLVPMNSAWVLKVTDMTSLANRHSQAARKTAVWPKVPENK